MKKKNLNLKLNLAKQTVLNLTEQNIINGGAQDTGNTGNVPVLTADCAKTQGYQAPCCPGCRSGANATVVKEFCGSILLTIDANNCMIDPAG